MGNRTQKVILQSIETFQFNDLCLGCLVKTRLTQGDRTLATHLLNEANFGR